MTIPSASTSISGRKIRVIGVPLDLGQSRRGVDMGPSAVRVAGLEARLEALGHEVEDGGNVAGGDAVTRAQDQPGLEWDIVYESSIFAAQILDGPIVSLGFEGKVLARQAGVFRETDLGGARPSYGHAFARQRHGLRLPIRAMDEHLASWWCAHEDV